MPANGSRLQRLAELIQDAMIEIDEVQPVGREMRPLWRGWGGLQWLCIPYTYAFIIGFSLYGIASIEWADGLIPTGAFVMVFALSYVVWFLSGWALRKASAAALAASPTGNRSWRWTIDGSGFVFDNGLQTNRLSWAGIKSVQEDKDRFVLLVTPQTNPVLPKRLLSQEQTDLFRTLANEHGVPPTRG